ncbi:uncharacterized protein F4807DRAFT_148541 [Annulohypoxylon truncatum]|uniref:uncharacterized protein n=1 Tax=Annulohypoxylon truncatum TaxID=327061 RepID=UPI002007B080|nr:uncharacterized protein F4807DRAFT_148541 [Annulohypoxylon truncatum]KAI1208340.1 hypothetical protein F4807DRAFT_148541 [Annulohypoxylon truncatum]
MPSSQRPFFLSSFLAAFRQQTPPALSAASQTNKHTTQPSSSPSASGARSISSSSQSQSPSQQPQQRTGGVMNQLPLQSQQHRPHQSPQPHRPGMPIPGSGRRRGSDSSSEGFRDVLGADKWYIGGRTAGGDERFFKLGVVKRVRSQDRLSLDRLSL